MNNELTKATCAAPCKPGTSPRTAPCILEAGHAGDHRIRVSQWLIDLGSHEIYIADNIGEDFTKWTGEPVCWPIHTPESTRAAIDRRGLGGSVNVKHERELLAYGYEIARALAHKYANGFDSIKMGRGSEFRDCLAALEAAGA